MEEDNTVQVIFEDKRSMNRSVKTQTKPHTHNKKKDVKQCFDEYLVTRSKVYDTLNDNKLYLREIIEPIERSIPYRFKR